MAKKKAKEVKIDTPEDIIAKANKMIDAGKKLKDPDMVVMGLNLLESVNGALPETVDSIDTNNGQYDDKLGIFTVNRQPLQQPKKQQYNTIQEQILPETDPQETKVACKNEPINVGGLKNKFVPPKAKASDKDLQFDKLVTKDLERVERRPAFKQRTIMCSWCHRPFNQHPSITGTICERCIRGTKG